jgi:serine/threonine-protein kinase PknG
MKISMSSERCSQPGCSGVIDEGYCDSCGHAAVKRATSSIANGASHGSAISRSSSTSVSAITTGTGSSPRSRAATGSRRSRHSTRSSTRRQLGAGLVTLPDLPTTDPEKAVLLNPQVPEGKRFCASCNNPLKRETGFCGKCGQRYSFIPTLQPGDVIAGQYEVKGAIAYGGLGWIYLAFDSILSRYVVLKGLLNVHDESSAMAAVAERKFLAAVKHPNIVGIYNFVPHGAEGFIVMEYVGGKTVKQIRQERGPLPVTEALAYIHRVLPAFSYLHQLGLVYCDFKPDNLMLEKDDVKLIDLGGVRRIDDLKGDIYGTVGYSAPEAGQGPTVESDLFTIGRALAVLITSISGFSKEHRYTLPSPQEEQIFSHQESLYRLLLKATAEKAGDRFESADEMAEQMLGVLREIVAKETNTPRPAQSSHFGGDLLGFEMVTDLQPVVADPSLLPIPAIDSDDKNFREIMSAEMVPDIARKTTALQQVLARNPKSREVRLRLAAALGRQRKYDEAELLLSELENEDAWDWRVLWYRGIMLLSRQKAVEATKLFDQVYFDLPGEIAPKLALALAAEIASNFDLAIHMYDLVSRTDSNFVSAPFGLARCFRAKADRKSAAAALERIPQTSAVHIRSRVAAARILVGLDESDHQVSIPDVADLEAASSVCESLVLEGASRHTLHQAVLVSALYCLSSKKQAAVQGKKILGSPLEETQLRLSIESSFRALARMNNGPERILMVEKANQYRPLTLF